MRPRPRWLCVYVCVCAAASKYNLEIYITVIKIHTYIHTHTASGTPQTRRAPPRASPSLCCPASRCPSARPRCAAAISSATHRRRGCLIGKGSVAYKLQCICTAHPPQSPEATRIVILSSADGLGPHMIPMHRHQRACSPPSLRAASLCTVAALLRPWPLMKNCGRSLS